MSCFSPLMPFSAYSSITSSFGATQVWLYFLSPMLSYIFFCKAVISSLRTNSLLKSDLTLIRRLLNIYGNSHFRTNMSFIEIVRYSACTMAWRVKVRLGFEWASFIVFELPDLNCFNHLTKSMWPNSSPIGTSLY